MFINLLEKKFYKNFFSFCGNYQTYESIFLNTTLVKSCTEGEWLCLRNRRVSTATLNVNYTGQYVIFMSYEVRYSGQAQAYAYPCTITSISPDASYTQIAPGAYLVELNGQHTININTGVSDGSCTNTGGYYAIYKVNN